MVQALTIAGSDSGGGAGIQADLRAFASVGVHGCSVLTCATAQNTVGVQGIFPLGPEAVGAQLRSVLDDIKVSAAKTGMLHSPEVVRAVASGLRRAGFPLVVDPVMVATVGASLHAEGFLDALVEDLLPRADLVTPNLDEARALTGKAIDDVGAMERAARAIRELGPRNVLVKGGHLKGDLVDVLLAGDVVHRFRGRRFPGDLHGSGCLLSSLVTANLARGQPMVEAVDRARRRVAVAFAEAYAVGRGVRVAAAIPMEDRQAVAQAVAKATAELLGALPLALVPEVGVNLVYAVPGAMTLEEVCGLPGRIVRVGQALEAPGCPAFGASRHVAHIVLAAMAHDPTVRSALNLRYSPALVEACRALGLRVGTFRRGRQPPDTSTMDWGTHRAIEGLGTVPDVVYDLGGPGKVAMVRVLGHHPREVVALVGRLRRILDSGESPRTRKRAAKI